MLSSCKSNGWSSCFPTHPRSQENLVDNGGILDEVVFQAKTDDLEDLAYLSKLLATSPRFRAEYPKQRDMDFSGMYSPCVTGTMCVKIDDDVVSARAAITLFPTPFMS